VQTTKTSVHGAINMLGLAQARSFCYVDDLVTGMIAMMDQDELLRRRPDITLAKEKLRWEPTIPLRDGLIRTIEYFRSHSGVLPG
jgi:nucleoside-diphosphate-sugar epimerase